MIVLISLHSYLLYHVIMGKEQYFMNGNDFLSF